MRQAGQVELRLLGRFVALRDGVEIPPHDFAGRKVRTLVKVLASRQPTFVSNDTLAEALWPERLPSDPVANLQVLVNRARRALGVPSLIRTGQGGYSLAASPACLVDAHQFLAALADEPRTATTLREALRLWRGDPLPEEAYDDWAVDFRAQLFRGHQRALEEGAALALAQGDVHTAVELASRAVEAEPLREAAVLGLIEALTAAGDSAAALAAYEGHRRILGHELGVEPSAAAVAAHERLLKGLPSQPVETAPSGRGGRSGWRSFGELAFVGRDDEVAAVLARIGTPVDHSSLVIVSGASGTGKSRLLDRVSREVPVIRARAHLPERSEPWSLARTLLREVVAQDIRYAHELPRTLSAVLGWLLPELEGSRGPTPDPESRRVLLHEAAVRLLDAAGTVVALDDLQWCDPSSLSLLEAAVARVPGLRLVVAFRPEEVLDRSEVAAFLARARGSLRVDLGALPRTALEFLVADRGVVEALARHTDRSPLAVTEVLRALTTEGLLELGVGGSWHSTGESAADRATTLAREGQAHAILGRMAAQPPRDRELLGMLALLAREASVSALATATGTSEPDVLDALGRLFRHGLVRVGEQGWATSHDMVSEVVAGGLDRGARARLHASLARAVRPEDDPARLALHLREAGDLRAAADAFALAAQRALDAFADDEAAHLADTGLRLAPPETASARLHEIRGQARQRSGDLSGARADLRTALTLQRTGPSRARVLARLAMLSSGADDLLRAADLAELAVVEARDDAPTRARALEVASVLDMNLQQADRSAQRAAEALALYEQLGDANGMARIIDARAMAQFLGGDVGGGESALRRAANLFEDSGDLLRVVTPRSTAGHALVFAGVPEEGLVAISAALGLARTLGHPEGQAYALWHRAEALAALGRGEEAAAEAAEALAIATRIGHRGWTATAWRAVGLAAEQQGDLEHALQAHRRSLEVSEHLGLFACWAASRTAMVLVATDAPADAAPLVARALSEGPPLGHYEARWAQVEVAAALGDPAAPALAREALDRLRWGGVVQGRKRLEALAATGSSA